MQQKQDNIFQEPYIFWKEVLQEE